MRIYKIDDGGIWAYNGWTDEKQNEDIYGQSDKYAYQNGAGKWSARTADNLRRNNGLETAQQRALLLFAER